MKFAKDIFPLGTFSGQKSAGAYIDGTLGENLDILSRKIVNDMHFLGIISGNDSVGNGKSTITQQVGCYLTNKINELHGTNNTFTHKNVFFNAKDLTTKSPELPKYSVVVLDEGDDLTTHGMKELAVRLKRYFRKCRQLNQIVLLILPSFFELPKFYALSRSHFLINVSFKGEYDRGYFDFYGPKAKKLLYLKGKKEWDYQAWKYDFQGRFFSSYCFFPNLQNSVRHYKKKKYQDMVDDHIESETDQKLIDKHKKQWARELFYQIHSNIEGLSISKLSRGFKIDRNTGAKWIKAIENSKISKEIDFSATTRNNNSIPIPRNVDDDDEEGEGGAAI